MNMAPIGILFFLLAIARAQNVLLTVDCKEEVTGQYGQQSLLECVVHPTDGSSVDLRVVSWKKDGVDAPLVMYNGKPITPSQDYKFAEPSWNKSNMNVSLLITNTTKANEGVYTCMVASTGKGTGTIRLKVTAKPSEPTVDSIPKDINKTSRTDSRAGLGGEKEIDAPAKWISPVVVIGSLIVGLLLAVLALLFHRHRRQNHLLSIPSEEPA